MSFPDNSIGVIQKGNMKNKIVKGILGEKAGNTVIAVWRWAWGLPIETGGKVAKNVAQQSLQDMNEKIQQLAAGVAKVVAAHDKAKTKYLEKRKEIDYAKQQAKIANDKGNKDAAKIAITKVIMMEKIMPKLEEMVNKSEEIMTTAQDNLQREKEKLETYKLELANLSTLTEMNEAMNKISATTNSLDLGSATSQFSEAQSAIEGRYLEEMSVIELSESSTDKLGRQLDDLTLEDEISKRLEELN